MHEEEWDGTGDGALLMNVVDVERAMPVDGNVPREHGEFLIQASLGSTPIVPARPVSLCVEDHQAT